MVFEQVMATKRHLEPSIRGVKMMKKTMVFKGFQGFDRFYHEIIPCRPGLKMLKNKWFLKQNEATTTNNHVCRLRVLCGRVAHFSKSH